MTPRSIAGAVALCILFAGFEAVACTPRVATNPTTGESYDSGSPEALRRQQAGWRARSDHVFVAQVREARMVAGGEIDFMLFPIVTVDGESPPDDALFVFRWNPGDTCNAFTLDLADLVVVYGDVERPLGWSVVGLTIPDQLQDPPDGFRQRIRDIHRGIIPGPPFPE